MIYLDNSATTEPAKDVLHSFQHVSREFYANPSSIHPFGGEAEELVRTVKKQAAQLHGIQPEEVILTSGGTEGNNLVIKSIALKHREQGKHMMTYVTEHPSVLKTCRIMEEFG